MKELELKIWKTGTAVAVQVTKIQDIIIPSNMEHCVACSRLQLGNCGRYIGLPTHANSYALNEISSLTFPSLRDVNNYIEFLINTIKTEVFNYSDKLEVGKSYRFSNEKPAIKGEAGKLLAILSKDYKRPYVVDVGNDKILCFAYIMPTKLGIEFEAEENGEVITCSWKEKEI